MTADRGGTAASISRRIHAFRPYNRMQMQLGSEAQIPEGLLAANALLAENSRQGFETYSGTVHQGFGFAISSTAIGISNTLYDGRVRSRYTGKERDTESGLDYFGARYLSSNMGRFMSPDWSAKVVPVPYASLGNPQTLNLYAYVGNNPLSRQDLDGHNFGDGLDCSGANANGAGCQAVADWNGKHGILSSESKTAISNSTMTSDQKKSFTGAVETAAGRGNIDPNILVGIAQQESVLGKNMNSTGAAKGLYGIESGQMGQINKMFTLGITTADLLSLSAPSMTKVSTGVADYIGYYAQIYSNWSDPRGIDVGISAWRVGIGQTRTNIRAGNFWDYVDPNLGESVAHYVNAVEKFDQ